MASSSKAVEVEVSGGVQTRGVIEDERIVLADDELDCMQMQT